MSEKVIFVTVGTTLFSALIDNIIHSNTINYMIKNHYTHLIIQYGKDQKPNIDALSSSLLQDAAKEKIHIELYDFKPSLYEDMCRAHMIICHAGAGTLTEAIRISSQQQKAAASSSTSQTNTTTTTKKIVTVINNQLMDNHQTELAYALQRRQLVHVIDDPQSFAHSNNHVWEQIDAFVPSISTTSLEGNPYDVPRIIHQFLGSRSKVETAEKED